MTPTLPIARKRIRWDAIPAEVRTYLDTLPRSAGGTVIERDGKPAYHLESLVEPEGTAYGLAWSPEKNRRRCELIDNDIDGGLTPDEHAELEDLELELRRHVNAVAPRPIESLLEEVRALSARFGLASGASM